MNSAFSVASPRTLAVPFSFSPHSKRPVGFREASEPTFSSRSRLSLLALLLSGVCLFFQACTSQKASNGLDGIRMTQLTEPSKDALLSNIVLEPGSSYRQPPSVRDTSVSDGNGKQKRVRVVTVAGTPNQQNHFTVRLPGNYSSLPDSIDEVHYRIDPGRLSNKGSSGDFQAMVTLDVTQLNLAPTEALRPIRVLLTNVGVVNMVGAYQSEFEEQSATAPVSGTGDVQVYTLSHRKNASGEPLFQIFVTPAPYGQGYATFMF